MKALRTIWLKLRSRWHRPAVKREEEEDLRCQSEAGTADAACDPPQRFGKARRIRELCRETCGAVFGATLLQDIRLGLRMLRKKPGFAAMAVLILALGIGGVTAMFSVVNAVLLRPLPYRADREIFALERHTERPGGVFGVGGMPAEHYADLRKQSHAFSPLATFRQHRVRLAGGEEAVLAPQAEVSGDFFALLGVGAQIGRTLTPTDARSEAAPVAVISYGTWQRLFGGQAEVLGKGLELDQARATIVGVMPRRFEFPGYFADRCEVWTPWAIDAGDYRRDEWVQTVLGRLVTGVSPKQAQAELDAWLRGIASSQPKETGVTTLRARSLRDQTVGDQRGTLLLLLGAVVCLLLMSNMAAVEVEGSDEAGSDPLRRMAHVRMVTPGYFRAAGIRLVTGREVGSDDARGVPGVVVNEAFVRAFLGGKDPLGRQVRAISGTWCRVVGVAKDVTEVGIAKGIMPQIYHPSGMANWGDITCVVVRLTPEDRSISATHVREILRRQYPGLPVLSLQSMASHVWESIAPQRLNTFLCGAFSTLALAICLVGIYGVVSFSVAQRTHEFGVRMALGAGRGHVAALPVRETAPFLLGGLAVGFLGAIAAGRLLGGLLFRLQPFDPPTFLVATAGFLLVALFACWLPARHAARVDPIKALRCE